MKKKVKMLLALILILLTIPATVFASEENELPGDDLIPSQPDTSAHTHTPAAFWSSDAKEHWHKCSGCSEKLDSAAHSWNKGKVEKKATTKQYGKKTYKCTVCGKTKTEKILKINPFKLKTSKVTYKKSI